MKPDLRPPCFRRAYGRQAAAFFVAAAATRNQLRNTRSRSQIAAYAGVAVLHELLLAPGRGRPITGMTTKAAAAATAIVLVKLAIEGFPEPLRTAGRRNP